jgi:RNA polymerase sigma factor (sigma-70 family)
MDIAKQYAVETIDNGNYVDDKEESSEQIDADELGKYLDDGLELETGKRQSVYQDPIFLRANVTRLTEEEFQQLKQRCEETVEVEKKTTKTQEAYIRDRLAQSRKIAKLGLLESYVLRYQQGEFDLFDDIYYFYIQKFERVARRCHNEDLVQELSIALLKAVQSYKANNKAKFNTYFWRIARNHMGSLKIKDSAQKRKTTMQVVSINSPVGNASISSGDSQMELSEIIPDESVDREFTNADFRVFMEQQIFKHLSEQDKAAINYYLEGYTLDEIGQKLDNITAPAIYIKLKRLKDKKAIGDKIIDWYRDLIGSMNRYNRKITLAYKIHKANK